MNDGELLAEYKARFTEKVEFGAPDAQATTPWIENWLTAKGRQTGAKRNAGSRIAKAIWS